MKTIIRIAWLASVLTAGIGVRAVAQDAPTTGKVLLLANDRVLEGDIEQIGDRYRIRRGSSDTLLPVSGAKRLFADWDEAVSFLRGQANLGDPDERLRLARWCHLHGLKEQTLVEARAALEMRPTHDATKKLCELLERTTAEASPQPVAKPAGVAVAVTLPSMDLSAESLSLFASKVQPILMNACARCHTNGEGGRFQLQRTFEAGARAATQRNLATTVAHLNLERPSASPLLVKAVSAHGDTSQPPLRDHRVIAFRTLHQFAEQIAISNPHLREPREAASPFGASPPTARDTPQGRKADQAPAIVSRPVDRSAAEATPMMTPAAKAAIIAANNPFVVPAARTISGAASSILSNPVDPFDPALFNK